MKKPFKCLYRQPNNRGGVTQVSVNAVTRWVSRGFIPKKIRLCGPGNHKSAIVFLRGEYKGKKAYLRLTGITWGYGGEGPRALAYLLKLIGEVPEKAYKYEIANGNDYVSAEPFNVTIAAS